MMAISPDLARFALDTAPVATVIFDAFDTVWFANQQVYSLFGYPPETLIGQRIDKLVPGHSFGSRIAHHERHMRVLSLRGRFDLSGLRSDGTEFPVELYLSPMEEVNQILIVAMFVDASHHARLRIELELARAAASSMHELAEEARARFEAPTRHRRSSGAADES